MTTTARKRLPIDAFIARKAEIDAMLARLQSLSEDHFNVLPHDVTWGDVGIAGALRRTPQALHRLGLQ